MVLEEKGYDKEEEYFHRKNQELLEKKRLELDSLRASQKESELKSQHWMRCPKCGHQMVEESLDEIMVDRCGDCGGIFFDAGELELLLEGREGGLVKSLSRLFKSP